MGGFATAVAMALVVGVAAGCGFSGDTAAGDVNTVDFLAPAYRDGPQGTKALWDGIIADFQRRHPAYRVKLHMESWAAINNVIRTELQDRRTTPDLLNLDAYASFARDGMLYPVRDVLAEAVLKDFQPGFAANATIDGTQYAMPLFASTRTLFYNRDLFTRAAVAAPPKTWAELAAAAKKIDALGGGISGYGMPLGSEEAQAETSIWTFGAGGRWSAGSTLTIDTPANLEGVTEMRRLIDSGVTQPDAGATDRKHVINAFIQGRIGMIEGLPPMLGQIERRNPGLNYATTPTPTKTGAPTTVGVADHLMAFVKDGRKREAVKAFLDYFYLPEVYTKFVRAEGFIPVTRAGLAASAHDRVTRIFGPTLAGVRFYPSNNPTWAAAQSSLQQNIGTIALGASPADVLRTVQRVADSLR